MNTNNKGSHNFQSEAEKFKAAYLAKTGQKFTGVISQSFIRAEVELQDANGNYTFDLRNAKGTKAITELLLKENDMFKVYDINFALGVKDSTNPAAYVPQTYPNGLIFEDEAGLTTPGAFRTLHLEAIYNGGYLGYKKGDTTYLPALSLRPARFVSQTQQSSATNKSSTEQNHGGHIPLARPFTIIGTDVGDLTMTIPGAATLKIQYNATATGHATSKVIAIVQLEGLLISGGNKISTAASAAVAAE